MFGPDVDAAAQAHAIAEYPKEACGVVANGAYLPLPNLHPQPEEFFRLPDDALVAHAPVAAVIHSHCHPRHGPAPTAADMAAQIAADLPFGIVLTDGHKARAPLWFGRHRLDDPLIGRAFMHGVTDCYSIIRSWYWQVRKIELPEFPRDDEWWKHDGDLYAENFAKAGFRPIDRAAAREGDVALMRVLPSIDKPHHGGVILASGLLLHHLFNRMSRREPFGRWHAFVTHVLRHASTPEDR